LDAPLIQLWSIFVVLRFTCNLTHNFAALARICFRSTEFANGIASKTIYPAYIIVAKPPEVTLKESDMVGIRKITLGLALKTSLCEQKGDNFLARLCFQNLLAAKLSFHSVINSSILTIGYG